MIGRSSTPKVGVLVVAFLSLAIVFAWRNEGAQRDGSNGTSRPGTVIGKPAVPEEAESSAVAIDPAKTTQAPPFVRPSNESTTLSRVDDWTSLIDRARAGDRDALEEAYRLLNPCIHLPLAIKERDEFIDAISNSDGVDPEERARTVATFSQRFVACDRIPIELHRAFATELFALRAENGSFEEKFQYIAQGFPRNANVDLSTPEMREYRERSRRFLNEALESGDPEALPAMAWAYRRSHVFRPDPARAYVYTYAHALVTGEVDPVVLRRLTQMEQGLIPSIIPALRVEAERVARCCSKSAVLARGAS